MTQPDRSADGPLGIGELARRTGLTEQALRAWESRLGFPTPTRTASGQRRYDVRDIARVNRVLALKESGLRLTQAVERVLGDDVDAHGLSVYGELRRRLPHLATRVERRDVLVAISHAIEDEALARAVRPLVCGTFQREEFYLRAAGRWEELARTAAACLVFADFDAPPAPRRGLPTQVGIDPHSPLLREWVVVIGSDDLSVVLTAWELPGQEREPGARQFEMILSLDPAAVTVAVETLLAVARTGGPGVADVVAVAEHLGAGSSSTPASGVDALMLRIVDYVQRLR